MTSSTQRPSAPGEPRKSLGSRLGWSVLSHGSGLMASVFTALVINAKVDPGVYGAYAVVLAIWAILATGLTWCGSVVMRFGPVEMATKGTLAVTVTTRLVFALPALALLLPGVPLYFVLWRGWPWHLVALSLTWVVVAIFYDVLTFSAYAVQRFRTLAVTGTLTKILPLVVVAVWLTGRLDVTAPVLLGGALAGHVLASIVLVVSLRDVLGAARPDRALLREMWKYTIPNLVGVPAAIAISSFDPLVLDWCTSRAEVGRYQFAYAAVTVFAALGASVNGVFTPELVTAQTTGDEGTFRRFLTRDQPALATFLGLGIAGLACVVPFCLRLVLSDRYASAGDLVALLTVAGCFIVGFFTLCPIAMSLNRIWSMQTAFGAQAMTNVGLDLVLGPRMGAVGIAVANIAAWCVAYVVLTALLGRRVGARTRPILPLIATCALVTALLIAPVALGVRLGVGAVLVLSSAWGLNGYRIRRALEGRTAEIS